MRLRITRDKGVPLLLSLEEIVLTALLLIVFLTTNLELVLAGIFLVAMSNEFS